MKELSILIPTYNDVCMPLATSLQRQAETLGVSYEIIVADDGSTDQNTILQNRSINSLPHCRYVERKENVGRAAIRNFLTNEAIHPFLVFIDADMVVPDDDFLRRYAEHPCETVIDGGVVINVINGATSVRHTLRYRYEKNAEQAHLTAVRRQHPYQHFHTANFLVARTIMIALPFDSRFRHYGYEDVFFGKQLQAHHIKIEHIDNPLSFENFEDNISFINKTEEGLRTLHLFQKELEGYSNMLYHIQRLRTSRLLPVIRLWHQMFGAIERKLLTSRYETPLWLFSLYRVGYFLNIKA